ncbi:OmpA family protein [Chromatiaceae bacterium AAb-1]|nr:OmpA family protein [Chromatiaceae bacterium AAb-1]
MNTKMTTLAVITSLSLMSAGVTAAAPTADELAGRAFGSLFGEYYWTHKSKHSSALWDNVDDGWAAGVELGYRIDRNWAVRAEYARVSLDSDTLSSRAKGDRFGFDALYHLNVLNNNLYLVGGWKHYDVSRHADAINLGIGYRHFFNDSFAFYAEANRYQGINKGSWYDAGIKLGLNWFFGASQAAPAPAPAPEPVQATVAPQVVDSDNDGVPDNLDKCPNTPAGHQVDAQGCTVYVEKVASVGDVDIEIRFAFDSDTVAPDKLSDVNQLAAFLQRFPDATVKIEGHASNTGDPDYNLRLSERRAKAVEALLVKEHGIDASRVTAVGYGITQPRVQGNTREAHRANQRIEAKVSAKIKEPVRR